MSANSEKYGMFSEFWKRYVDDVLGIWTGDRESFHEFVASCSAMSTHIKFTSEIENDEGLICLDLRLKLVDSIKFPNRLELHHAHYRKATASEQVLHYKSAHDEGIKKNYVSSFILRILQSCSDLKTAEPSIKAFESRLKKGEWPDSEITRLKEAGFKRFQGLTNSDGKYIHRDKATRIVSAKKAKEKKELELLTNREPDNVRMFIPCMVDKSYGKALRKVFKQCDLDHVIVQERAGNKLQHTFGIVDFKPFPCSTNNKTCKICKAPDHPKFKKPSKHNQTGCIYIIICMECLKNNKTVEYIGETERPLHVRFAEHLRKLSKVELHKYNNPKKDGAGKIIIDEHEPSAVSAHAMMEHNGLYNFGIGMIAIKKPQDERKVYEAHACKEFDPKLNRRHEGGNVVPN